MPLNHSSHLTTFNLTNSFYRKLKKRDTISLIKSTAPLQPSAQNTPEKNDLSNTQIKNENQSTREEREVVSMVGKEFLFISTGTKLVPLAIFENKKLSYIPETEKSLLSQYSFLRKGKIQNNKQMDILSIPDSLTYSEKKKSEVYPLKTSYTISELVVPKTIQNNTDIDENKIIQDFIKEIPFGHL